MKLKKIYISLIIFLLVIGMQSNIYGKYVIENSFEIATVSTDETKPVISYYGERNTNSKYTTYANKTHTVTVRIKVVEKNISINNLIEKTKVFVGGIEEKSKIVEIKKSVGSTKMSIFDIKLENLSGNGILELEIAQGAIIDIAENENDLVKITSGITIDNMIPEATFEEVVLEDGKVQVNIIANEKIQEKEGWTRSSDVKTISKEFPCNVSYPVEIIDFAQNSSIVDISITGATYIVLNYGSYNQGFGWSFNTLENKIAGKEAIEQNDIRKTEILAFRTEGKIDNDFLQVQAYVHTYWGESAKVVSNTYETVFCHGYNPSLETYNSMLDGELVYVNGQKHFILGGDGLNREGKTSVNINTAIPSEVAEEYPFGVSSIKAKLKDETEYSAIYQIYVHEQGWQKTASDGEESTYSHDKPITGFRMVIVPKSEKEKLMEYWNANM